MGDDDVRMMMSMVRNAMMVGDGRLGDDATMGDDDDRWCVRRGNGRGGRV